MWAISLQELKGLTKGIRSIIITLFITGISLLFAYLAQENGELVGGVSKESAYTGGLSVGVIFFGILFVFILSHDAISKESQNRTMRFLVTKTSRRNILLGKAIGITLFWAIVVLLSVSVISLIAKMFFIKTFLQCIVFLFYGIAISMLVSTLSKKGSQSLFIGLLVSLVLPVASFATIFWDNLLIQWIKYLTPYYYMDLSVGYLSIVVVLSLLIFGTSTILFEKRDL
ncbi:ABC transporter permease [Halobacillus sp. A5]|uniref:ABC transporter permease n=1 Tax=Halobacillus sp. A5 TaxID=2880263 RepID=UPI0020A6A1DC|nr:ABC transporter permease subunit [Halobacillus sp. A5]MCP3029630.1 ABC transporter permease [Halobacillus sp. A5]